MAEAVHILVEGGGHAVGLEHAKEGVGAPAEQQADQFVVPWKTRWTEDASTARATAPLLGLPGQRVWQKH